MGFFSSIKSFFKSEEKPQVPQAGEEVKTEEAASPKTESEDVARQPDDTAGSAEPCPAEEAKTQEEAADDVLPVAEPVVSSHTGKDSLTEEQTEEHSEKQSEEESEDRPEEMPVSEAKSEPVAEFQSEAKPEAETVQEPAPESAVAAQSETEPELETVSEPASESVAEPQAEAHTETLSVAGTETEPVSQPEAEALVEPEAEIQPEPETVLAPVPAPDEEPQAVSQPEGETLSVADTEAEAVPQPEAEVLVQPEAEIQPEPSPEKAGESQTEHQPDPEPLPEPQPEHEARGEKKEAGGFLSGLKRFFGGGKEEDKKEKPGTQEQAGEKPQEKPSGATSEAKDKSDLYQQLMIRLREADSRLSVWLDIVLDGVTEAGPELNDRISFLLRSLEAPADEVEAFVKDFDAWLARMEYRYLDEFRSELQYRLSLALDLEDEEDERSRLFIQLSDSLAKTRAHFARKLDTLISSHGELDDDFWQDLEELFIMADLGVEAAMELTNRLKEKALAEKATTAEATRELLRQEIRNIFVRPKRIVGVNPPEVVLMIGVNGAGKTTTIAKLAYRDRMQGKKVMIAAADTFRAAAIDQMRVWAERVGTLFHAKQPGSDPASVAFEAMDRALAEGVDVLYVDTAGRLQTKVNLMDELSKIRAVLARKHPGSPHRTVLVLDATTGQNALSQAKLFKEAAGVDELILTKLDGTAKGGVAIAVAMQYSLPISYVGMGEKVEDLRPFNGDDYADALFTGSMQG